jgi:hypothetical protein
MNTRTEHPRHVFLLCVSDLKINSLPCGGCPPTRRGVPPYTAGCVHPVCLVGLAVCTPCALWGAVCMHPVCLMGLAVWTPCVLCGWLCVSRVYSLGKMVLKSGEGFSGRGGATQPAPQDTWGSYSQPHKTHGVHTASPPQGTRGAYSHPHKTHGVHTISFFAEIFVRHKSQTTDVKCSRTLKTERFDLIRFSMCMAIFMSSI